MTVNRTTLLDLPLPVTGTESGTWGDTTNNGLTQYMDIAIAGMSNLTSANFTAGALTIETTEGDSSATNISATSAQYAGFRVSSLAVNSTITVGNTGTSPARSYRLINADATYNLTFKATGQTGVTLLPGQSAVVAFNGTDYVIVGTVGAGTATDNAVARFDGTTGEILQNSAATIDDTGAATFVGSVNVSGTSASAADLKLYEDTDNGTNYVAFKSPASVASNVTWTLPSADGTNGQALTTNGSGTLAFSSVTTSPGGSTTQVQYNNAGAFGGSANFVFDGTNVGIGASSPADKLDVRHAGVAARFTSTNGNNNQIAFSNSATAVVGFYMGSPAADVLQFSSSAGTERMRITSAGDVGIGTSSPLARLTVSDSTATNGTMTLGNNASYYGGLQYTFSTGELRISQVGGASLGTTFYTNGSERMRIDSSGNVGIGVTPPTVSQGRLLSLAYSGAGISVTSGTSLDLTDNAYYNTAWKYGQNGLSARFQLTDDQFIFFNAATGTAGNNITWSERMRINASGNVGIGTSSPSTVGNGGLTLGTAAAGKSLIMYSSSDGNNGLIQFIDLNSANAFQIGGNSANIALYGYGSRPMIFYTNDTERMRILSGGNVCINQTSDTLGQGARLHITGNSAQTACSIKIGSDGVPGWYFANSAGTKVGDIVINTSSTAYNTASPSTDGAQLNYQGITFRATQSASSDANTLDDYEEGSWTPNQGAGLTVSGSFQSVGTYIKIGRLVVVRGSVGASTSVSISPNGIICSNLPFSNGGSSSGNSYEFGTGSSVQRNGLATGGQVAADQNTNLYSTSTYTAVTAISFVCTYITA